MTALASRSGHAPVTLSTFLEDGLRWATFVATYGVICTMILGLLYLVSHTGSVIER